MTRPAPDTVAPQTVINPGGATTAADPGPPAGAAAAIRHKVEKFDDDERQHGLPVNQATENERLQHARQLLESVSDAVDHDDPYRERLVALAAVCVRWVDYLDEKASQGPASAPRRAPRAELVRRFLRQPPAAL